jgi:hypothetical protein
MQVIHFTEGATDPIDGFESHGVRFVPLAAGQRDEDATVSCYHLAARAWIAETPFVHDCVLLLVQGRVILWWGEERSRLDMSGGMGAVLSAGEPFLLETDEGAVVLAVESPRLSSTAQGRSCPRRIAGQRWPGERRTLLRAITIRWVGYLSRWWRVTVGLLRGD